jgi:hypothetical protein
MPVTTVQITPDCFDVIRTTNGDPNTTTLGRLNGNRINFANITYFDYSMRRKAEVLQYNKISTTTSKTKFSNTVNRKGSYSQATLKNIINATITNTCPIKITSSSNSGVNVNNNIGYYLDINIPFNSSL